MLNFSGKENSIALTLLECCILIERVIIFTDENFFRLP